VEVVIRDVIRCVDDLLTVVKVDKTEVVASDDTLLRAVVLAW